MDIDTSELRKLAADLGSVGPRVGAKAAKALRDSAERVKKAGAAAAPRGATGNLSDSVGVDLYGMGNSAGMTAVVGPTEHYGRFVEVGTAKMAAQPFMGPAFADEEQRLVEAISKAAEGVLDP